MTLFAGDPNQTAQAGAQPKEQERLAQVEAELTRTRAELVELTTVLADRERRLHEAMLPPVQVPPEADPELETLRRRVTQLERRLQRPVRLVINKLLRRGPYAR